MTIITPKKKRFSGKCFSKRAQKWKMKERITAL